MPDVVSDFSGGLDHDFGITVLPKNAGNGRAFLLRPSNKTSPAAFPNEQEEGPGERVIAQARWM